MNRLRNVFLVRTRLGFLIYLYTVILQSDERRVQ
jgi:hypothetical protein